MEVQTPGSWRSRSGPGAASPGCPPWKAPPAEGRQELGPRGSLWGCTAGVGLGQSVQGRGPAGSLGSPKEKGPGRGFRRRRLHQSLLLERSLTAGWRTARRGKNQIKLEGGARWEWGGGGWDSPRLARSPGPSQEADPPIVWVCARPITPKGPPTPQHLPVHIWESEVPHRRGPQPTRVGPHSVLHADTPFSCPPPRPPPSSRSPGLWPFIRCAR